MREMVGALVAMLSVRGAVSEEGCTEVWHRVACAEGLSPAEGGSRNGDWRTRCFTCAERVAMARDDLKLEAAARAVVADEFPEACGPCGPRSGHARAFEFEVGVSIDPRSIADKLWVFAEPFASAPHGTFGRGYNPSIAVLPSSLRRLLAGAGWRRPTYLATFRHGLIDQCGRYLRNMPQRPESCQTSLAILDDSLRILVDFLDGDELWNLDLMDARLVTSGDIILVHGWNYDAIPNRESLKSDCPIHFADRDEAKRFWKVLRSAGGPGLATRVFRLELSLDAAGRPTVAKRDFDYAGLEGAPFPDSKNLGFLWSVPDEPLTVFLWAGDRLAARPTNFSKIPGIGPAVRNNGSPLPICDGAVLANVVHTHYRERHPEGPIWPIENRVYLHAVAFYEPRPPYDIIASTPLFCFPSLATGPGTCDTLQFVMSLLRDPDDPDTLIFTYGTGDCLSNYLRIDLPTLLNFAIRDGEGGGDLAHRCRRPPAEP
mmetsp:Transcript_18050/g.56633  ORF Transcript_18050/g.56633 Transcript_18050/m.56633 type:complete len:487 (+) Transcript_18050:240-1700(+)